MTSWMWIPAHLLIASRTTHLFLPSSGSHWNFRTKRKLKDADSIRKAATKKWPSNSSTLFGAKTSKVRARILVRTGYGGWERRKKNCPKFRKSRHCCWMTQTLLDKMAQRRKMKNQTEQYPILPKVMKHLRNEATENFLDEQCRALKSKRT